MTIADFTEAALDFFRFGAVLLGWAWIAFCLAMFLTHAFIVASRRDRYETALFRRRMLAKRRERMRRQPGPSRQPARRQERPRSIDVLG